MHGKNGCLKERFPLSTTQLCVKGRELLVSTNTIHGASISAEPAQAETIILQSELVVKTRIFDYKVIIKRHAPLLNAQRPIKIDSYYQEMALRRVSMSWVSLFRAGIAVFMRSRMAGSL